MSHRRLVALVAALVLAVAACQQPTPSPSNSPSGSPSPSAQPSTSGSASPAASADPEAIYARINAQVQAIRGLDEREPIEPRIVSPNELRDVLERTIREETPPELLAAYERLYKGMDLLDADASLEDLYVDLLQSQVAGLYDPATESLYVLSKEGDVGAVEKVYYSHEYLHALQDQHFGLEALTDGLTDQTDRQLAIQALVEGDAYTLMTIWLQQNLQREELMEVLQAGSDPEATAVLQRIPPIIRAQILFSAIRGTLWIQTLQAIGGWEAVDAAFADPPQSTEQILHADKWEAREAPIEVEIPDDIAARMGDGWSEGLRDTFGEHQLGIWLGDGGIDAAAGWGGDRAVLLDGPDEAWAIAILTVWDDETEASEFADAATVRFDATGADGGVSFQPGTNEMTILLASSGEVAIGLDRILGDTGV